MAERVRTARVAAPISIPINQGRESVGIAAGAGGDATSSTGGPAGDGMLLEGGGFLLLESGDYLLLE